MSGKLVGMVFDHYPGSGGELLLAVKLADNAHDDGARIFPAVETLARTTRQSPRTVQRQLRQMENAGWLQLVRYATGGRGKAREYRINPIWLAAHDSRTLPSERPQWPPSQAASGTPDQGGTPPGDGGIKGDNLSPFSPVDNHPQRVTPETQKGDTRSTKGCHPDVTPTSGTVINNTPLPPTGDNSAGFDPQDPDGFDAVWREYPRQRPSERAKARSAWLGLKPTKALQEVMIDALRRWRKSSQWQREDGRFVPKLALWLSRGQWQDDPASVVVAPDSGADGGVSPACSPGHAPMPDHVRVQIVAIVGNARGKSVAEGVDRGAR